LAERARKLNDLFFENAKPSAPLASQKLINRPKGKIMFKRKPETQQLSLNQFNAELAALVDRAIAARVHLVDIRNALDDQMQAVDFKWAQRAVI
jgi:hypothetical protein